MFSGDLHFVCSSLGLPDGGGGGVNLVEIPEPRVGLRDGEGDDVLRDNNKLMRVINKFQKYKS